MISFSVCTDAVFGASADFSKAVTDVRAAGFDTVEFWDWRSRDLAAVKGTLDQNHCALAAMCTTCSTLNDQSRHENFLAGLEETIAVAEFLSVPVLITQTGMDIPSLSHQDQLSNIASGLKRAVPILERAGRILVFEPLNVRVDHPGYLLSRSEDAFAIARQVGNPHVKVLFDIYHQQITEGDLIRTIQNNIDWIGHFHAAGNPGRGTPLEGEINYDAVFAAIAATGYAGKVGLEYFPDGDRQQSLQAICRHFVKPVKQPC